MGERIKILKKVLSRELSFFIPKIQSVTHLFAIIIWIAVMTFIATVVALIFTTWTPFISVAIAVLLGFWLSNKLEHLCVDC